MSDNNGSQRMPLSGIRVLDLGRHLAGPACGMFLGDLGADVIKVESPDGGDHARASGPPFFNGEGAFFLSANRNKRSITLDTKLPEGQEVFRRMADQADVVIENFRPGVVDALNIGYEVMSKRNPRIIYVSISGFGADGPFADRQGLDQIVQGFSGLMSITGFEDGPPVRVGIPISDLLTGLFSAYGVLAALNARHVTGRGQVVTTSLLESMVGLLAFQAVRYLNGAGVPPPAGNHHPINAPYGVFRCKGGYVTVGGVGEKRWRKLCEVLDMPELPDDPRFKTNGDRYRNRLELAEVLEERLMERTSDEWELILNEASIPAGPIYRMDQVMEHPQILHRKMVVEREHPAVGNLKLLGLPVKFSETPTDIHRVPPLLGQHTDEILTEFGYGIDEIEQLKAKGVVGVRSAHH